MKKRLFPFSFSPMEIGYEKTRLTKEFKKGMTTSFRKKIPLDFAVYCYGEAFDWGVKWILEKISQQNFNNKEKNSRWKKKIGK